MSPKEKTVLVSGGFDPLHVGHVRMFKDAANYGNVVVAINSDEWLERKKGYVFMSWEERAEIIEALEYVTTVIQFDDSDGTACDAILKSKPYAFANGGDRKKENTPEMTLCNENDVKLLWEIGGDSKPQSSSWLVNKAIEKLNNTK